MFIADIMLGIEDPLVALAYLLCLASSLLCIGYGAMNWNKGDEPVQPTDVTWAQQQQTEEQAD